MIEGMRFTIKGTELKEILEKRATVHGEVLILLETRLSQSLIENYNVILRNHIKECKAIIKYITFFANHVVVEATYSITKEDVLNYELAVNESVDDVLNRFLSY